MKVLVTGACGRVGPTFCKVFAKAGHDVLGTDIRGDEGLGVPFEAADLAEPGVASRLLEGCDALIHLGNVSTDTQTEDKAEVYIANGSINIRVFEAAREAKLASFIFASSIQVTAGVRTMNDVGEMSSSLAYLPADGGLPINPRSPYGLSKAAGEQLLAQHHRRVPGSSCFAIRFPYLSKENPKKKWGPWDVTKLSPKNKWHFPPDELFSHLRIEDAAALVLAAVEQRPAGLFTLFPAANNPICANPIPQLIDLFYAGVPLRVPADEMPGLIDNSPITELLGWSPSPSRNGGGED